ncbi:DUF934 domain-containing protein [Roseibium aggregatum]|uniref:DUF934 domain-containing protein n=1 Tax=Roseibium aggregatum TaxID=187304 RepID=A0A939J1Y1_9HYPH|nr:DUF934 domain-containing protein [Roseibium aggregatum]MBN9668952.1 DUF934 domain-containing protein [Roseibium aggregatum]
MATIYKDGGFAEENWARADAETGAAVQGDLLVAQTLFLADAEGYLSRQGKTAIVVEAGDDVEDILPYLGRLALVAVDFPAFSDGRGFSAARILREQFGYEGDIRALGKYILDQVPLARRCGVTSFEITKPEVLRALKAGEWPEVTKYLQPVGTVAEIPEGTRPWARRSQRETAVAAE